MQRNAIEWDSTDDYRVPFEIQIEIRPNYCDHFNCYFSVVHLKTRDDKFIKGFIPKLA